MEEEAGVKVTNYADIEKLKSADQGSLSGIIEELPPLGIVDEGELLGILMGATKVEVARRGDDVVAVRINGEPEDTESETPYPVIYGDETVFDDVGGRRRSRLKKQARRTQRKRRNRKGKQLRKLTTRRR